MQRLEKSQIANIFNEDSLDKKEILAVLEKELGIVLDEDLDTEEQIDEVFRIYTETLDKLDEEGTKKFATHTPTGKVKLSRKEYVLELISKRKYTKEQLIEQTNDYFEYEGKSSKGRVNRVIRELKHSGTLVELTGGILGIS